MSKKKKLAIIVTAHWAGDTTMLENKLIDRKPRYPKVHMCKIDIDRYPNTSSQVNIYHVPTTIAIHQGVIKDYLVGLAPGSRLDQLLDRLK